MKRLLALLLVLGLASVANAAITAPGIFGISVDGVYPPPPDTEIFVDFPSGELILDVHSLEEGNTYYPYAFLLFAAGPGTVAGGDVTWGAGSLVDITGAALDGLIAQLDGFGYPGVTSSVNFEVLDTSGNNPPIPVGPVADGILFHCDGPGDVLIALMDFNTGAIFDEIIIHQVPEPMTLSLLGLGGLGLLRRRR